MSALDTQPEVSCPLFAYPEVDEALILAHATFDPYLHLAADNHEQTLIVIYDRMQFHHRHDLTGALVPRIILVLLASVVGDAPRRTDVVHIAVHLAPLLRHPCDGLGMVAGNYLTRPAASPPELHAIQQPLALRLWVRKPYAGLRHIFLGRTPLSRTARPVPPR